MQKVADYIADFLAAERVPAVFELVGGMITHLLDAVHLEGTTPIISMRHEQGAAFAVEGCSRMLGRPAVAMATSGPGATNLLTGMGSCYFDSTPSVFITGQVNTSEQKGDRQVRQLGFQETDIVSMASPITKQAWRIEHESQIGPAFRDAFRLAVSGRPGPVLIDIPMNIQRAQIDERAFASEPPAQSSGLNHTDAAAIRDALLSARMPMILAGGGIRGGNAIDLFRDFVELASIPVVHSLMAVDVLPYAHPLNAGMIGSYGNRWANLALSECDCLLVLGSRLDVRQTGANTEAFKGQREIFHIDCEAAEMNNRVQNCRATVSEIAPALKVLIEVFQPARAMLKSHTLDWRASVEKLRTKWPDIAELTGLSGINPNSFMHILSRTIPQAAAYVTDVGQHQMWAAQSLELRLGERFLTSGGMGSMGFALPAAIGAATAVNSLPTIVIAGDGGFQCNIQELETVAHLQLPIKIVILNNECHGMVRQFQESYFESRFQSTVWGYSAPNFARVAEAYQIPARTISRPEEISAGTEWLAENSRGPSLLQVMVPQTTNVYPKLAFGYGLESMEPFAKPLDMEGT
jgi:acetolactate synthase-1/2/3 large subunit